MMNDRSVGNDPLSGIEIEKKIMETKVPSYVSEHHIETTDSCRPLGKFSGDCIT